MSMRLDALDPKTLADRVLTREEVDRLIEAGRQEERRACFDAFHDYARWIQDTISARGPMAPPPEVAE